MNGISVSILGYDYRTACVPLRGPSPSSDCNSCARCLGAEGWSHLDVRVNSGGKVELYKASKLSSGVVRCSSSTITGGAAA